LNYKLFTIIAFSYSYGFFEIFMGLRQRFKRKRSIVNTGDKGSIWIMFVLIGLGYFLSFQAAFSNYGRIPFWNEFFVAGFALILMGLVIRILSIAELKQHFTYTVTEIENHELVETGLYKNIRHPGYLGQILVFLGTSLAFANWLSVVLMMLPVLAGYLNRIIVEEMFMTNQLGQKYVEYQKRTKRLIPKIY
jgi:protein-S-isoprenylcysteine O-methyltransferase Ste14